MFKMLMITANAIGSPVLGIIIPGIVLIIAFSAAFLLYRHFSKGR